MSFQGTFGGYFGHWQVEEGTNLKNQSTFHSLWCKTVVHQNTCLVYSHAPRNFMQSCSPWGKIWVWGLGLHYSAILGNENTHYTIVHFGIYEEREKEDSKHDVQRLGCVKCFSEFFFSLW